MLMMNGVAVFDDAEDIGKEPRTASCVIDPREQVDIPAGRALEALDVALWLALLGWTYRIAMALAFAPWTTGLPGNPGLL